MPRTASHGQLSHAEQRARRGLRLTARASGMWALTGLLDDIDGARLAELLEVFSPAPDAGVDPGQTLPQRRADALAAMAAAAAANRAPLGTCGLSVLIDAADLTDAQQAVLADATPITADTFDLLTCTAVCTLIFGTTDRRRVRATGPGPHPPPGHRHPMGRTDRPRPGLHPLRTQPPVLRSPPHRGLAPRRPDGCVKHGPAVLPLPPRPAPRPLHHHHDPQTAYPTITASRGPPRPATG